MQDLVTRYMEKFKRERRTRRRLGGVLLTLALVVTVAVYWQLRLTGAALTNETYCGLTEHQHDESCYEYVLVCGYDEGDAEAEASASEADTDADAGVSGVGTDADVSGASGVDTDVDVSASDAGTDADAGVSGADMDADVSSASGADTDVDVSASDAGTDADVSTSGADAAASSAGHVHTDACYEKVLVCGLEEHTHTVACLSDETADVETASVWEATIPEELSGVWADDLIAVAESQLGYTESAANFILAEDGATRQGYTRYGAWAGNAYGDWDAMFASFCLHYAGVSEEEFPEATGAYAWVVKLQEQGLYADAADYAPTAGDLVFFDSDLDGRADTVGILTAVEEDAQTSATEDAQTAATEDTQTSATEDAQPAATEDAQTAVTENTPASATANTLIIIKGDYAEDADSADAVCEIICASDDDSILGYGTVAAAWELHVEEEETAEEGAEDAAETTADAAASKDTDLTAGETENTDDLTEQTLTVETDGATVTLTGLLPEGATVTVEPVDVDITGKTVLLAFEISIFDAEGNVFEPQDDTILVTIASDAIDSDTSVYYVPDEGDAEEITSEAGEGEVVFDAEHFSTYALTATSTDQELNPDYYDVLIEDVTYGDSTVTGALYINFMGMVNENKEDAFADGYNFYYYLGDFFEGADLTTGRTTVYASDRVTVAYYYTIEYDEETGGYYVYFEFNRDFIESEKTITTLDFHVQGTVNEDYWEINEDGDIVITVGTDTKTIYYEDIKFTDDGETTLADISVSKFGSYDASSGTLNYTIIVSTEKGTGDSISLSDYFKQNIIDGLYIDESGSVAVTVTKYTTGGEESTTKTVYISSIENYGNGFSLELEELEAEEYYVITYSLTVANQTGKLNISGTEKNTVTVETDNEDKPLTDEDITNTVISETYLSKTGAVGSDGTIKWIITVNTNGANIAGYVLTDEMLTDAVSITVNPDEGYEIDGDTISFTAVVDTDEDEIADSNFNTYTITYTTPADQTLGEGNTVENTANLDSGDGKTGEVDTTVWVSDGSLEKTNLNDSSNTIVNADGTMTLYWTSTLTVPEGGIASGTVILDCVESIWNSDYALGVSYTHQWYTYSQITKLFGNYYTNGLVFIEGTTEYTVSDSDFTIEAYYFEDDEDTSGEWINYETLVNNSSTYENGYFTAWRITFNSDITFDSKKATLTLNYETTADASVVDGVSTTSYSYSNGIKVGNLNATDSYTYEDYARVVKTDGNGKSDDTSHTITGENDNTLTWIVKVYIPAGSTYENITVTDTLPEGVELSNISLETKSTVGTSYGTAAVTYGDSAWASTSSYVAPVITGSSETVVTLTIDEPFYETLEQYGGFIYITYTCEITDSYMSKLIDDGESLAFKNNVTVSFDGDTDEGEDEQTQTVTYEEPDVSAVDKTYYWDNDNDRLTYYVLLNPEAKDLLEDSDELTFTDTFTTMNAADGTWGMVANLNYNSVAFYTVTELTDGEWSDVEIYTLGTGTPSTGDAIIRSGTYTYTDSEGDTQTITYNAGGSGDIYVTPLTDATDVSSATVYLKTAVDIAWTYSEEITEAFSTYEKIAHIITATVPDSTKLLVEYTYQITYTNYIEGSYNTIDVSNTAQLSGSISDTVNNKEKYTEVTSGGSASYRESFTLTKVDVNSYGTTLAGATYTLYQYNGSDWKSVGTYITDDDGQISFNFTASGIDGFSFAYNTAYYLVESVAPEGYLLDSTTKYYFYWSNSGTSDTAYPDDWSSLTTYDLSTASHSVAATNTPVSTTSVTVKKAWVDENGESIAEVTEPDTITFSLYRYTIGSSDSGSSSSDSDTVTVYWKNGTLWDEAGYSVAGVTQKNEQVVINLESSNANDWLSVYIGDKPSWASSSYYDNFFQGTITISATDVTGDIYILGSCLTDVSIVTAEGSLTITKTFKNAPGTLNTDNVTFSVTDSTGSEISNSPITYSDMTSGSYTISDLPVGTYTITESYADVSGYTRTTTWDGTSVGNSYSVTVTEDGTIVGVENSYEEGIKVVHPTGSELVGTYTVYATDGWTLTVGNLAATDSESNTYYYYVEEVADSGYTIYSYTNNEGVNTGTITITNQMEESYELPSAGGSGTRMFTMLGALLCGGAGLTLYRRRRRYT